jgi:hypothetical protein
VNRRKRRWHQLQSKIEHAPFSTSNLYVLYISLYTRLKLRARNGDIKDIIEVTQKNMRTFSRSVVLKIIIIVECRRNLSLTFVRYALALALQLELL